MTTTRVWMPQLLLTLMLGSSGCTVEVRDSDESSEEDASDDERDSASEASDEDDEEESVSEDEDADDGSPTADEEASEDDSTPMYVRSECGDIPPSDLAPGTSASDSVDFAIAEVVKGQLDPENTSNREHFWQVDLERGYYHVVMDATTNENNYTNLAVDIEARIGAAPEYERLLHDGVIDRRYRDAAFIHVEEDATVRFRLTSGYNQADYLFAVFKNGMAVPSPQFADCPGVTPLTVGETATFALGAQEEPNDKVWYSMDLEAGEYVFDLSAMQETETNLGYRLILTDEFGQVKNDQEVASPAAIDFAHTLSQSFTIEEDGFYFLRFANDYVWEYDMTATVSAK